MINRKNPTIESKTLRNTFNGFFNVSPSFSERVTGRCFIKKRSFESLRMTDCRLGMTAFRLGMTTGLWVTGGIHCGLDFNQSVGGWQAGGAAGVAGRALSWLTFAHPALVSVTWPGWLEWPGLPLVWPGWRRTRRPRPSAHSFAGGCCRRGLCDSKTPPCRRCPRPKLALPHRGR